MDLSDEQLIAAYKEILATEPQLPIYRRTRMVILDLLEERGRAQDRLVASLKAKQGA